MERVGIAQETFQAAGLQIDPALGMTQPQMPPPQQAPQPF
jgi:hypothetical protein